MEALNPEEGVEEVIEAAKALVSKEMNLPSTGRPSVGTEASALAARNLAQVSEANYQRHSLALGRLLYILFLAAFSIWVISLLVVSLPLVGWPPSPYPSTLNDDVLAAFQISAGFAFIISLSIGVSRLRK